MKKFQRFILLIVVLTFLFGFVSTHYSANKPEQQKIKVLVLLGEWFGDAYFPLKKEIESRGWEMKRIGIEGEYRGCYNKARDVALTSEILIKDFKDYSDWDCLIIPSGPQFRKFSKDETVLQFLRDANKNGLLIASFCVGNILVGNSGLVPYEKYNELFYKEVKMVKPGIIFGPRGGGPPPGDGFKSAPIKEICDAIEKEVKNRKNLD